MTAQVLPFDRDRVWDCCSRFLARADSAPRHLYANLASVRAEGPGLMAEGDRRLQICEAWRFPIVEEHDDARDCVTFVYAAEDSGTGTARPDAARPDAARPNTVSVLGTFDALHAPIPLQPLTCFDEPTGYFAVSLAVPRARAYTYTFVVDGEFGLDPTNPQIERLDNGATWSRFFTTGCRDRLSLEAWETEIIRRLADEILPFQTPEGKLFLARDSDRRARSGAITTRDPVINPAAEVANHIDKLLAREECDRLLDYKLCLPQLHQMLRDRYPNVVLSDLPRDAYCDLYADLASGDIPGWNYERYENPLFFLQLLRRHTCDSAFAPGSPGERYLSARAAARDESVPNEEVYL